MRSRTVVEKLSFSVSLLIVSVALAGTRACQEDYDFASQTSITPEASVTPTDNGDDGVVTITPTITRTPSGGTEVPTATPETTPTVAATASVSTQSGLFDALRAVGTKDAAARAAEKSAFINPYAEALKGKPENWLGNAFKDKPEQSVVDSDGDGFADWLETIMGSNPRDALNTPPAPLTHLKDRIGMDARDVEDRLRIYDQMNPSGAQHADIDHDGISDDLEMAVGSDANSLDTDGDGILDRKEFESGSDPVKPEAQQDK